MTTLDTRVCGLHPRNPPLQLRCTVTPRVVLNPSVLQLEKRPVLTPLLRELKPNIRSLASRLTVLGMTFPVLKLVTIRLTMWLPSPSAILGRLFYTLSLPPKP